VLSTRTNGTVMRQHNGHQESTYPASLLTEPIAMLRAAESISDETDRREKQREAIHCAARNIISLDHDEEQTLQAKDTFCDVAVDMFGLDPHYLAWQLGDALEAAGRHKAQNIELDRRATKEAPVSTKLKPYDIAAFLALEIPPREMILAPIIQEKSTAMLYASRGNGKTHVAHGIALAVATGAKFLKWEAPKPRRVLIIDGEMPASELQKRLSAILWGAATQPEPGMLNLLSADLVEGGIGNLADPKVQAALDPWLTGIELLILDNLSCLTTVIKDNDAESWGPIQEWLLRLRRRGISVLIVHHAGKGGGQRGTSRREDILDTSISLRRPDDYAAPEGARFEVHIEKGRGIHGKEAEAFEARLETRDGIVQWTVRELEDAKLARVMALHDDELTLREIADQTGIPKSTVDRMIRKTAEAKGAQG
jgi:putative DNA primase/helicase